MLPNGLYKVTFETHQGADYGVMVLADGKLRGGDSGMAYVGTYKQAGDRFTAELSVTQHRHVPGVVSALGQIGFCLRYIGLPTLSIPGVEEIRDGARHSRFSAGLEEPLDKKCQSFSRIGQLRDTVFSEGFTKLLYIDPDHPDPNKKPPADRADGDIGIRVQNYDRTRVPFDLRVFCPSR